MRVFLKKEKRVLIKRRIPLKNAEGMIAQILKDNADENTFLKEVQKVKTLLDPTSMGERFKAIIVRK